MKLLILGITGRTGRLVAEEAIQRGHKVVGIARDPGKVTLNNAEIISGTPYDFNTVQNAISGCDAVISALSTFSKSEGLIGKIRSPLDVMSVSIKNTVKLMETNNIKRIVVMTALGVGDSAKEISWLLSLVIRLTNIKHAYADHNAQEKVLENSNLDWTVVRPVRLTDKNEKRRILYNIKGIGKIKSEISRKAVANFMIDCVEKSQFIRQKPGISND
jgi:putative NADH-flavin reductase